MITLFPSAGNSDTDVFHFGSEFRGFYDESKQKSLPTSMNLPRMANRIWPIKKAAILGAIVSKLKGYFIRKGIPEK